MHFALKLNALNPKFKSMSTLFLSELPELLTPETLLADVLTSEFTVAALRGGVLTPEGLKSAAGEEKLPFSLYVDNQKALEQILAKLHF